MSYVRVYLSLSLYIYIYIYDSYVCFIIDMFIVHFAVDQPAGTRRAATERSRRAAEQTITK